EPSAPNGVTRAVPHPTSRCELILSSWLCLREYVAHGEHSAFANQPTGRDERAFREHAAVARDVLEMNLLERCVEYELVRARDRSDADARDRDRLAPCRGRRLG